MKIIIFLLLLSLRNICGHRHNIVNSRSTGARNPWSDEGSGNYQGSGNYEDSDNLIPVQDISNACGGVIKDNSGTITSPSFPNPYPPNKICTWEIVAPPHHKITLNFTYFSLENSQDCKYDYLDIRSKIPGENQKHGVYCGSQIPLPITSIGNSLKINFKSDPSSEFYGFKAIFSAVKPNCKPHELPCENGECVVGNLWCDYVANCVDGTDEKYCNRRVRSTWSNRYYITCPYGYFKCSNGPCIPNIGRCRNFTFCQRNNEAECTKTTDTIRTTQKLSMERISAKTKQPVVKYPQALTKSTYVATEKPVVKSPEEIKGNYSVQNFDNYYVTLSSVKYETQLQGAIKWLISKRDQDFGWGVETARALTAFYISGTTVHKDIDLLMKKQLEVQIAVALTKNKTSTITLSDLALYINALMAACRNTRNFNGFDLVDILRQRVNREQHLRKFINPSVYLTLCLNGQTSNTDVAKIQDFMNINTTFDRIGLYSLAVLASSCYENASVSFQQRDLVKGFINQLSRKIYKENLPKNVYDAALLLQALDAARINGIAWRDEAMNILLESQNDTTGSFENFLGTYYAIPVLAGRTLLSLPQLCNEPTHTGNSDLKILKSQQRTMMISYTLRYGNPVEMQQSLHLKVPPGTNFLNVMRLAEDIDPNYRFKLDKGLKIPQVYSIGGIPNDAEKGLYWRLYHVSSAAKLHGKVATTVPSIFNGNNGIKGLILQPGDEAIFWLAPVS